MKKSISQFQESIGLLEIAFLTREYRIIRDCFSWIIRDWTYR